MFLFFGKKEPKPYHVGWLSVGSGHSVYYQQFGNPEGDIVLSFHGGPGGCGKAKHASHYDLKKWRVIMFDQRGCGLSCYSDLLKDNTAPAAVQDGKALLDYLKIKGKITIAGGSYGAGLALLFAETYPTRVKRLILNSVFLMRKQDVQWVSHTSRLFYPDLIDEMRRQAGTDDIVSFYHRLIFSDKYKDLQQVQKYYAVYEKMLGRTKVSFDETPALTDAAIRFTRIYLHYEKNHFFVKENQLLQNIQKIKNIPTLIVHNRLDFCCPVEQAFDLHQALPKSKLVIVPDKGHSSPLLFNTLKKEMENVKS